VVIRTPIMDCSCLSILKRTLIDWSKIVKI
jgi:hypothetical protein